MYRNKSRIYHSAFNEGVFVKFNLIYGSYKAENFESKLTRGSTPGGSLTSIIVRLRLKLTLRAQNVETVVAITTSVGYSLTGNEARAPPEVESLWLNMIENVQCPTMQFDKQHFAE